MVRGAAGHDVGDPARQQVGAHGAAQVAIGDDADQPAGRHRRRRGSRSASRSSAAARGPSACRGGASGTASPVCIRSRTRRRRVPSRPPGWIWWKSAAVKPRRVSSATASASPSAICMVVEVVGARPIGQASAAAGRVRATSAARGQRRAGARGDRHQRQAEAARVRDQVGQFGGLARIGQRQHRVARHDHAQVAVRGLGRVDEQRRRAGGGERGGDLAGDQAGLAHAGDHHAAGGARQQIDRVRRSCRSGRRPARAAPPPRCAAPSGRHRGPQDLARNGGMVIGPVLALEAACGSTAMAGSGQESCQCYRL